MNCPRFFPQRCWAQGPTAFLVDRLVARATEHQSGRGRRRGGFLAQVPLSRPFVIIKSPNTSKGTRIFFLFLARFFVFAAFFFVSVCLPGLALLSTSCRLSCLGCTHVTSLQPQQASPHLTSPRLPHPTNKLIRGSRPAAQTARTRTRSTVE